MKNYPLTFITVCLLLSVTPTSGKWERTGWPSGGPVSTIAVSGATEIAGTEYGGVYVSGNNGDSWRACNAGLPLNNRISNMAVSGGTFFAGTDRGVFLSTHFPKRSAQHAIRSPGEYVAAVDNTRCDGKRRKAGSDVNPVCN